MVRGVLYFILLWQMCIVESLMWFLNCIVCFVCSCGVCMFAYLCMCGASEETVPKIAGLQLS